MMKKRLALLLVGVMTVATFSGCVPQSASNPEEEGKIVISVSDYPAESKPEERAIFDEQIAIFEEEHPNIKVVGDTYQYSIDTFITKAASNQLPTFYSAYFTETDRIVSSGYAADLTQAMKKYGFDEQMNDQIKGFVTRDDKIYGLPKSAYFMGMTISVPLFKQAGLMNEDGTPKVPDTYDELREMAVTIKEKTGMSGFGIPTTNNRGGWKFMNIAWSYGVDFMKQENGKWIATFDTPECVEALTYVKDLKWKYDVLPANVLIDGSEINKLFGTKQLGMTIESTESSMSAYIQNYDMTKDDVAMSIPPAGPKGRVAQLGGTVMFIAPNATEEQIEACMEWAKFQGWTPEVNDKVKENWRMNFKNRYDKGNVVGIKGLQVWDSPEFNEAYDAVMGEYLNIDPKFFEGINSYEGVTLRAEEPMCCQELYKLLDSVIQEVLTNKDADPAVLIKQANADFQTNYLDNENN